MKLLEFKPPTNTTSPKVKPDIKRMIADLSLGVTHDLPSLRYAGPQRLFLWDNMQTKEEWDKMSLNLPVDIRTDWYLAVTTQNFVPIANCSPSGSEYPYFLPLNQRWYRQINKGQMPRFQDTTELPLKGKLVSVGVKALRAFDEYYSNGLVFDRIKLPIKNPYKSGPPVSAWVYVNRLDAITKYDPHEKCNKFGSTIDPMPFKKYSVSGNDDPFTAYFFPSESFVKNEFYSSDDEKEMTV